MFVYAQTDEKKSTNDAGTAPDLEDGPWPSPNPFVHYRYWKQKGETNAVEMKTVLQKQIVLRQQLMKQHNMHMAELTRQRELRDAKHASELADKTAHGDARPCRKACRRGRLAFIRARSPF